jgi:predicted nucleic acid-binding protein
MRLVVDTNVFVSAALKASSWPGDTIRWIGKYGGLLKTAVTEQEILTVLYQSALTLTLTPRRHPRA